MVDASGQGLDGHQPDAIKPKDLRSFIFEREIAEVYLLLDFLSGRADKNLSNAFKGAGMPSIGVSESGKDSPPPPPISPGGADAAFTQAWIGAICSIKWPPEEPDKRPPSSLATTLLLAKDHLNSAAAPANGLSIAFSLMVAGDDEYRDERHARRRNYVARMLGRAEEPMPVKPDNEAASRTSLARQGYPTLVKTAATFRRWIGRINLFLVAWLALTCFLSWHVAIGHALVLRLDALEAARITLYKQIPGTEVTPERPPLGATTPAPAQTTVKIYCPSTEFERLREATFDNPAQRRLCFELADNRFKYRVARENLADWLALWAPLKSYAHWVCGGRRCLEDSELVKSPTATNDQWAASLLEVLATAVLPLCYGFLGAGAAVVRGIWRRMRDSLLTPRDLRLALSQLALGAVIGACIGLFITPGPGSAQEGAALFNGPVALSASALSFIAGFGVEGVFQAMESLIRRVFNVSDGKETKETP